MTQGDRTPYETNACDQCYRTKQTCTKEIPQCRRCANSSTPCTYSFGKFKGKPKKTSKARPAQLSAPKGDGELRRPEARNPHQTVQGQILTPGKLPESTTQFEDTAQTAFPRPTTSSADSSDGNKKRHSKLSACDQCYRFKVKCIRTGNSCQRCTGNFSACTFSFSSASEEDDTDRLTGGAGTKRRRLSDLELPATRAVRRLGQEFGAGNLDEGPWEIHAGDENMLSAYGSLLPPQANGGLVTPVSLDVNDPFNRISSETIVLDPTPVPRASIAYDISSASRASGSDPAQHRQEMFTQGAQKRDDSRGMIHTARHGSACSCLASCLSTLSNLHQIGHPIPVPSKAFDLNNVISTTCSGLFICENVSDCKACSGRTKLMLCLKIMQQVMACYGALNTDHACHYGSTRLSIQIGETEFSGIAYAPAIMEAILNVQKKTASRVCDKLLSICAGDKEGHAGNKDDGVRQCLALLKHKLAL